MNADEIVKALKTDKWGLECAKCDDASCDGCETKLRHDAAGLIESLQAQLVEQKDIVESMRNYETEAEKQVTRDGEQIKELLAENEQLTAQLAASQRREKAAVDDLGKAMPIWACKNRSKEYCPVSAVTGLPDCSYCGDWQWRGPQERLR